VFLKDTVVYASMINYIVTISLIPVRISIPQRITTSFPKHRERGKALICLKFKNELHVVQSRKHDYILMVRLHFNGLVNGETNAAFTHTGLTTRCRTKSLYKSIFVLSRPRNV